jgi:broad specificity phosphatase PhoE
MSQSVFLIRHGQTEWSESGKHTGRTDIPLTSKGIADGQAIAGALSGRTFALVLTSPLQRARETCRLAGYGDVAVATPDLMEWDYGAYEGLKTVDIRAERPGWLLWSDGCPSGETAASVGARCDRVIASVRETSGDVALFAHGHVLRVLAARWLGLPPEDGKLFALGTATMSVLGYEREIPVMLRWNESCHLS